jgi:hypothetical protein
MAKIKQEQPISDFIPVAQLDFDKKNPRFPRNVAEGPTVLLLERFVRDERLLEIIDSIGDRGYFPGEPLLVVKHKSRYTVVEGNRRLAALKLLSGELDPPPGRISIENAVASAKIRPEQAPCLIFKEENQILRYLGFRHITGIKSWGALQKARYIERLRVENYGGESHSDSLRLLARETGSKSSYMGQTLSALALYDYAEEKNFFNLGLNVEDIDFSVLSTSLSYSNILEYVGLEGRSDISLESLNPKHLEHMFLWLFVTKNNQKSVVGESRNLKKLAEVVASPPAVKELLKNGRLDEAYEYSKGPAIALTEALAHAERRLNAAWQWLPKVADVSSLHRERAEDIARVANSILVTIANRRISEPSLEVADPSAQTKKPAAKRSSSKGGRTDA